MKYVIQCDCGQSISVDSSIAGREVQCVRLSQLLIVPSVPDQEGKAVAALKPSPVLAATSLKPHRGWLIFAFGLSSLLVWCLGPLLGPAAWMVGNADIREIDAGLMDLSGKSTTEAGRICGIVRNDSLLCSDCRICPVFVLMFALGDFDDAHLGKT